MKCDLFYEASVGGRDSTQFVRWKTDSLSDRISALTGIVNGTTNFILTKMKHENMLNEQVLAEQLDWVLQKQIHLLTSTELMRHEMVILASLAFSTEVHLEDVFVRGLKDIQDGDVEVSRRIRIHRETSWYRRKR